MHPLFKRDASLAAQKLDKAEWRSIPVPYGFVHPI
jgi:hypothetical protein